MAIVIAIAGSLSVAWGLGWVVGQLWSPIDTGRLAYKPSETMPPHVDLANVQRLWPAALNEPGDHKRLTAYQQDIERAPPPPLTGQRPAAVAIAPVDLGALLASADATAGKAKAQVCVSCHDFTKGGPDRIGPNLWGVIGRQVASRPGFSYSPAMTAQHGAWSYDRLFAYLASPARAVPGNRMSFAGVSNPQDRAAVIRFLATLGDNPPPLPHPQATQPQTPTGGKVAR
jgi:cytochrome c